MGLKLIDEVTVGEHLLPALINGDETGLESHDLHSLERDVEGWLAESDEQPLIFDVNFDGGAFFGLCHITGLYNNCYELKVYSIDQNTNTDGDSSQD